MKERLDGLTQCQRCLSLTTNQGRAPEVPLFHVEVVARILNVSP